MEGEDAMDGRMMKEADMVGKNKVLGSRAKVFVGITMAMIVPLCVVVLVEILLTKPMVAMIILHVSDHRWTSSAMEDVIAELAAYLFFVVALSFISTSAIVYTAASIYTDIISTSSQSLLFTVMPRHSFCKRRLFVGYLWGILLVLCFLAIFFTAVFLAILSLSLDLGLVDGLPEAFRHSVFIGSFMLGLIYVECVLNVGSVVAVLEEAAYGRQAMKRSVKLIQGRMVMAYSLYCIDYGLMLAIWMGFGSLVANGESMGWTSRQRVAIGAAMSSGGLSALYLAVYMVCKAFRKAYMSEH